MSGYSHTQCCNLCVISMQRFFGSMNAAHKLFAYCKAKLGSRHFLCPLYLISRKRCEIELGKTLRDPREFELIKQQLPREKKIQHRGCCFCVEISATVFRAAEAGWKKNEVIEQIRMKETSVRRTYIIVAIGIENINARNAV